MPLSRHVRFIRTPPHASHKAQGPSGYLRSCGRLRSISLRTRQPLHPDDTRSPGFRTEAKILQSRLFGHSDRASPIFGRSDFTSYRDLHPFTQQEASHPGLPILLSLYKALLGVLLGSIATRLSPELIGFF